jgi:RNA polymerase sigma-70 factor (ECF subfamily)
MVQIECAETMTMDSSSAAGDEALAGRAAHGDRAALEELLTRHGPTAMSAALAVLRREELACEAAQEALIYVARHLADSWSGGSFKAWVAVSAQRAAVNLLRAERNRARKEQFALPASSQQESSMTAAEKNEMYAVINEEIANEPEETVAVLVLHHIHGLPVSDVATECKIGFEACKKRLARGRESLRERLERRGVTPAMLNLLPVLLNELGRDAGALNVPAAAVSKAVAGALSAGTAPVAVLAAHSATLGFKLAVAGVVLGVSGLAAFAVHSHRMQTQQPAAGAPDLQADDGGKDAPRDLGPSHWQRPRIVAINAESVWPTSLSANGKYVAIFAETHKVDDSVTAKSILEGAGRVVIYSSDWGASWRVDEVKIEHFAETIAVDSSGACSILAANLSPEGYKGFAEKADAVYQFCQQWYTYTPAHLTGRQSSWPRDEWAVKAHLAAVPQGTWAFTKRIDDLDSNQLVAAYGAAGKCPELLPQIDYPRDAQVNAETAWAFDDNTAGFVGTLHEQLVQFKTDNQGRSWQQPAIQFKSPDGAAPEKLSALAVAREGKRLVLIVKAIYADAAGGKAYQILMLSSDDLGEHWNAPKPVSKRHPHNGGDHISRLCCLHVARGQIGIGWSDISRSTFVLTSTDDGTTWSKHPGFAAAGVTAGPFAVGGDDQSLHVAIGKNEGKKCWLMIQSFTPGEWKSAAPAAPDWFKAGELDKPATESEF